MSSFVVLKPGLLTTIQDLGRPEGIAQGIPWGGVMDRTSARLANALVANPVNAAVIEIMQIGPVIQFEGSGKFAITGAALSPSLNGHSIENNKCYSFGNDDVLSFGKPEIGTFASLAIQGSIDVPYVLGSKSTYLYAKIGGWQGRALQKDDRIAVKPSVEINTDVTDLPQQDFKKVLRIMKGPEFEMFTASEIARFLNKPFTVGAQSNRMGFRLENNKIVDRKLEEIISSGTLRGVVQITPSGTPVVLMADSPTVGGYPRIAIVVDEDVDRLAQIKPMEEVFFELSL